MTDRAFAHVSESFGEAGTADAACLENCCLVLLRQKIVPAGIIFRKVAPLEGLGKLSTPGPGAPVLRSS